MIDLWLIMAVEGFFESEVRWLIHWFWWSHGVTNPPIWAPLRRRATRALVVCRRACNGGGVRARRVRCLPHCGPAWAFGGSRVSFAVIAVVVGGGRGAPGQQPRGAYEMEYIYVHSLLRFFIALFDAYYTGICIYPSLILFCEPQLPPSETTAFTSRHRKARLDLLPGFFNIYLSPCSTRMTC